MLFVHFGAFGARGRAQLHLEGVEIGRKHHLSLSGPNAYGFHILWVAGLHVKVQRALLSVYTSGMDRGLYEFVYEMGTMIDCCVRRTNDVDSLHRHAGIYS